MEAPKPAQEASETGSSTSETSSPSSEGSQVSVEEEFEELDMDALRIDEVSPLPVQAAVPRNWTASC